MWKRNNVQKMIAIALGVMMLTGCAGGEQPTQSVQTEPAAASENTEKAGSNGQDSEKEQVTIQYWHQGTSQADTEFTQKCIDSFEEKYPYIKVEATGMSSTISDQETKLNAAVLSDTYPDVIQLVLAEVGSRGALGDFEKLDGYVEGWEERRICLTVLMRWANTRESRWRWEFSRILRFMHFGKTSLWRPGSILKIRLPHGKN